MHDPVEIRRRIEMLLASVSRRDDYGQLLAAGQVVVDLSTIEDAPGWRAGVRRQARADRIEIRTGITDSGTHAYAVLVDGWTGARENESDRYTAVMRKANPRASALRHQPALVLRDGDESICKCERCSALGLVDTRADPFIGGSLFEDECPHDDPPATTAMGPLQVATLRCATIRSPRGCAAVAMSSRSGESGSSSSAWPAWRTGPGAADRRPSPLTCALS